MDSARVVDADVPGDGGSRRPGRRRWLAALAATTVAAPLMSGSAIAVGGGSTSSTRSAAPAPAVQTWTIQTNGRHGHLCHRGEHGRRGEDAAAPSDDTVQY